MQKIVILPANEPLGKQLSKLAETMKIITVSPAFSLRPGAQPRFDGYAAVVEE